jgi:biotin operon repressor
MNLVEGTVDGDEVVFGGFRSRSTARAAAPEAAQVVVGIRPEAFEAAASPPRAPTLDVEPDVVEELGSDATSSSTSTREAVHRRQRPRRGERCSHGARRSSAPGRPACARRVGEPLSWPSTRALPLLRPETGRRCCPAAARRASSSHRRAVTKQARDRDRVFDLIDGLGVGEAIPSERQLSADLGVSRLTVRAALDELAREGYLVRRRGSGTFVSEPKIAQELTMTSFTEDMRRRGMQPGSKTLGLEGRPRPARGSAGSCTSRRRSRSSSRSASGSPTASRWRSRRFHVREALVPGLSAADLEGKSFYDCSARVTDRDLGRHADDRADGDRTRRSRRHSASRCTRPAFPVRAVTRSSAARSSSSSTRSTAATATGS